MPKCCVCNASVGELNSCLSTVMNERKYYCEACLQSGFEPYSDVVNYGFDYDMFSNSFIERILNPTLRRNNKSIEQFNSDVKTAADSLETFDQKEV